ncbi:MAG: 3-keto-disaccharide hydrolase [Chitinophagaceae bacterium]
MKQIFILICGCLTSHFLLAQVRAGGDPKLSEIYDPAPAVITPGNSTATPPSDAIILFDGKDFSKWVGTKGKPVEWTLADGAMTVKRGAGLITTKESFGDCQLHIEWRTPSEVKGEGQGRGNSGIFLMGRYELQVLDSYNNKTYSNGQAGSIYKQLVPLVNASKGPGEWQTYDVIFTAPRFSENGIIVSQARITVLHNGVLIQNNATIWGGTEYIGIANYKSHGAKEPISLQDHGDAVSFRNIWIRPL